MRSLLAVSLLAFSLAAPAFADEVTTKTTVTTDTPAPPAVVVAPPVAVVPGGGPDCSKTTKTATNEETGTSVSKTVKHCD